MQTRFDECDQTGPGPVSSQQARGGGALSSVVVWLGGLGCLWLLPWLAVAALPEVATPTRPVTDEYHGLKVGDDYRWLEQPGDPEVRDWTARQNGRTRAYFEKSGQRDALAARLAELYEQASAQYFAVQSCGSHTFVMCLRPPAAQPILMALRSRQELNTQVTVVDPNKLDPQGGTAIDWYVPSPDGRWVAVCLSRLGSEDGALHFFETATGKKLADEIPRVQYPTAGGSAAWDAEGTGVFYTRYPAPGERSESDLHFFQQVYFHSMGTPLSNDSYEVGREFPRIAEIELESSEDHRHLLASVANGDGGDFAHWLRHPDGSWQPLTRFEDGVKQVRFGRDQSLYLLSRRGVPRGQILRLPLAKSDLEQASILVKEGEKVIASMSAAEGGCYVSDLVGGPSRIRFFNLEGKLERTVPLPPVSAVGEMVVGRGDELLFRSGSYTVPFAYYLYDPASDRLTKTELAARSPVDFSDVEVLREWAPSKDGTRVPLNILRRKGTRLDGNNPALLYGYGGYGVSLSPSFDFTRRLWLDAGGVLAMANLRGGGEFGEDWHKAGNLTKKQNVFDDFVACGEWLIRAGYTQPAKLAIEGGSNGGLLVGAALTQRPDLFRAAVAHVGIFDMLRVELEPNGAFNVTEFGTVQNKAQFDALVAYSPYHHVTNGLSYPAVFLTTGENDGRVNPYNSRKMAARLQAATGSGRPVLLRTSASAGHGLGTALQERIALRADTLAFLMRELGVAGSELKP